jgi:hypothetical protein
VASPDRGGSAWSRPGQGEAGPGDAGEVRRSEQAGLKLKQDLAARKRALVVCGLQCLRGKCPWYRAAS